jgi:hypothetical protein
MNKLIVALVAAGFAVTVLGSPAMAAGKKSHRHHHHHHHAKMSKMGGGTKMAMTMKCPACGMEMGMTKSDAAPVAVKVKGATYYCCADCASGKAAMMGGHKGMKSHKAKKA